MTHTQRLLSIKFRLSKIIVWFQCNLQTMGLCTRFRATLRIKANDTNPLAKAVSFQPRVY